MGMSASQARFLQLTARKSNVEYQAQRINFERLRIAQKASDASMVYNDKMSNKKLTYSFTGSDGKNAVVDLTYKNYKNYMNEQSMSHSGKQIFLVSSSGNKIVVQNEAEMQEMISKNTVHVSRSEIEKAQEQVELASETGETVGNYTMMLAKQSIDDGSAGYDVAIFSPSDFMIVDDLDDSDMFQQGVKDGTYYFATQEIDKNKGKMSFDTEDWQTLESGAISEEFDKSDDAAAQSEYDKTQKDLQLRDKKLELELNKLNTEREAIETEMESVKKVIEDNVESSFKTFS